MHTYIDDIVIDGKTIEEHNKNLQLFLDRTKSKNLTISHEKSVLGGTRLRFLGHIITSGTIVPDPQRSASFVNFPIPTTRKQLQRFIGSAVYHAKWIPGFSKIMDRLFTALTALDLPLKQPALDVIAEVKNLIKKATLHVVNPHKQLVLTTDGSGNGITHLMKIIQSSDEGQNFTNLFEDCLTVVKECSTCAEIKPRWSKLTSNSCNKALATPVLVASHSLSLQKIAHLLLSYNVWNHFFIFLDHQNLSIQIEDWNSFNWRCLSRWLFFNSCGER